MEAIPMAVIQRYRPFWATRGFDETFDRLWRGFGAGPRQRRTEQGWALPLDVAQDDERLVVNASLPGFEPSEISISVDDDVLTIRAEHPTTEGKDEPTYLLRERGHGSVRRSLRLPDNLDIEQAESEFRNGVLTVTFPKIEDAKPRQIEVKVGS
jgi:HSP20 family protein